MPRMSGVRVSATPSLSVSANAVTCGGCSTSSELSTQMRPRGLSRSATNSLTWSA
ncbi:MAG: hypothetical protein DWI25_04980 [Planctomycetota bacterium]|nr:MAG: hypothetical protein DWI25_04980 [Planctomycetota bacterium]